jgi:hypothetical protein
MRRPDRGQNQDCGKRRVKTGIKFKQSPKQNALTLLGNGLAHLYNGRPELEFEQSSEFKGLIGGGTAWHHRDPLQPGYFFGMRHPKPKQ